MRQSHDGSGLPATEEEMTMANKSDCAAYMFNQGKVSPRTCRICGLGPCRYGEVRGKKNGDSTMHALSDSEIKERFDTLTSMEKEILEECCGVRDPRPWGAAVGACLGTLAGKGLIRKGLQRPPHEVVLWMKARESEKPGTVKLKVQFRHP